MMLVSSGETVSLDFAYEDGRRRHETAALSETGELRVPAETIGAGVKTLDVTPGFATAKKGEDGYFLMPDGLYGTFHEENGEFFPDARNYHPVFMMKTPRVNFMAHATGLVYSYETHVVATNGEYRLFNRYDLNGDRPCEDLVIRFSFGPPEKTWCAFAREYRDWQLKRGACRPIAERVKTNPTLKYAIEAPEIRIRQAWKPVPSPVPDQTPENEPPVKAVVPFDRVADIAREFRRQGIDKAEFCLVGWQVGGHDGRWPQVFPVEPKLGGEERLRACIRTVKDLGYLIVPHGNYLDAYRIAESWDEEWLLKDLDGVSTMDSGSWGGGSGRRICPRRAYERFMSREMPRMKALGFKGLGYFDVVSIVPARYCGDPRHPLNGAEAASWWGKGAELSKSCFGGFASEGAFDHFAGSLDYGLYVSFNDPQKYPKGLVDRMAPLTALVYNGIFASNPFTRTVNFTAQNRYCQLKLIEFGGRPAFYFYSKFVSDGTDWMGDNDLRSGTDEELTESVGKVRKGWDVYRQLSHLQFEFMEGYDEVVPGVWRTSYANGERVYVNYNKTSVSVGGMEVPPESWRIGRCEK